MNIKIILFIIGITFYCLSWAQPEAYIERDDVPFLIGQWATFEQNTDLFEWEPFDSTRLWWDLTGYPGLPRSVF
jgi:hypothetical protein